MNNKVNSGKPSKMVYVYDLDYNLIGIFPSTAQCARTLNLSQGNISNCCNGSLDTYRNMIFSFIKLDDELDRIFVLQDGEEKHDKRLEQINKAVHKYYNKDVEAGRARARKYYAKTIERRRELQNKNYHKRKNQENGEPNT